MIIESQRELDAAAGELGEGALTAIALIGVLDG
jgi:hypothetical protein